MSEGIEPRAYGKPRPVLGPDGRCHACSNCLAEDREAEDSKRLAEYGYQVLGASRPCLRAEEAQKPMRQIS